MKPYGMTRIDHGDTDCSGCTANGRASAVAHLRRPGGDIPTFRSLRGGKKAAARRGAKRAARREGDALCRETE